MLPFDPGSWRTVIRTDTNLTFNLEQSWAWLTFIVMSKKLTYIVTSKIFTSTCYVVVISHWDLGIDFYAVLLQQLLTNTTGV